MVTAFLSLRRQLVNKLRMFALLMCAITGSSIFTSDATSQERIVPDRFVLITIRFSSEASMAQVGALLSEARAVLVSRAPNAQEGTVAVDVSGVQRALDLFKESPIVVLVESRR